MSTTTLRHIISAIVLAGALLGSVSCGEVARTGRSPAFLIIDSLSGARGNQTEQFTANLLSDVHTIVMRDVNGVQMPVGTVFNDVGQVSLRLGLKNIGVPTAPLGPTSLNDITVTRYRVVFRRADGRNTPGVDVPHGFDGAVTVTVSGTATVNVGFELVRFTQKLEPPLANLRGSGGAIQISTIAEVTFYGRDQVGNEVTVTGMISINFADFADATS